MEVTDVRKNYNDKPHARIPALDASPADISWFEFAPSHLFYTPVALYCGWLTLRHMGLTLPTNTNPHLPFSGLVGESKFEVMEEITGPARDYVSPYVKCIRWSGDGALKRSIKEAREAMAEAGLALPLLRRCRDHYGGEHLTPHVPDDLNVCASTLFDPHKYWGWLIQPWQVN